jgi:Periplasmic protease
MKTKYVFLFIIAAFFASCGEDRTNESYHLTVTDHWIEEEMLENYYWYEDIPPSNTFNYFRPGDVFFNNLLSKKDGKAGVPFSRIERIKKTTNTRNQSTSETTYGMEFALFQNPAKSSETYARVIYTIKNSPAEAAGIKRGDWIFNIDDKAITPKNLQELYSGNGLNNVSIGYIDENKLPVIEKKIDIPAAIYLENNPVYYHNTYDGENGKKIGYLVYNSFVSGEGENSDTRYLNELRNISNEFKAEGVNEFVLDLRYNPGGELNRPVPFLCTMLAPESAMGNTMAYVEYNDKNSDKDWTLSYNREHLNGGSNLNLSRVFVITSTATASASEAVIKFLDAVPNLKVRTVGMTTVGKNVGSEVITHDTISWVLQPIVCKLYSYYDGNKVSEYEEGIKPTYTVNEFEIYTNKMEALGDENELLLKTAIDLIHDREPPAVPETRSEKPKLWGTSLDRKHLPGALIIR